MIYMKKYIIYQIYILGIPKYIKKNMNMYLINYIFIDLKVVIYQGLNIHSIVKAILLGYEF